MTSVLITNTHVVSLDPEIGTIPSADVLVVDGRIAAIAPDLGAAVGDAERIDGTGTIAIPGFVDTHRHTFQNLIRGDLASATMGDYFGQVLLGLAPAFGADDVYAGTLIGAYEALNSGVTTIVDWANVMNTPDHADASISALGESGIRAMFGYGPPSLFEYYVQSTVTHPEDARRVAEKYFSSTDQLLTYALALRGPQGLAPELNTYDFAFARELGARITVHAGVRLPGMPFGDVRMLHDTGVLGPDVTVVHGNESDDEELDQLAAAGATVSVAPYVEMVMGHGNPPTNRLLAHGLAPSLSMDVACAVPGDMFTQMRTALAQSRNAQLSPVREDFFAPDRTPEEVLRFATVNGAVACGLDATIGTLTVGKDADIVLIRSDAINTIPGDDPFFTVVTAADTSNVDTVLVRGSVVKRHGRLVGVDMARLRTLGSEGRQRVHATAAAAQAARG
jgi:5-methylthioadenosine/S-adenosylhomocysteine deaminase